jgi:hypothetical protein
MSTMISAACWPLQGMSVSQKAVLISLADQASDDGVCWPAVKSIALRTCLSERAVQDALAWLQAVGIVFREYRANTSTSYTIRPSKYDPSKAPSTRQRAAKNTGANGAPPADSAPGANGAPPPANGAPEGADGAPLGVQTAHPNHQLNRNRTVTEPLQPTSPTAVKVAAEPVDEKETALQAACRATWAAYSEAYERRYGAKPVRNQAVNAKVKQFVLRIGHEESPAVAEFYVDKVSDNFVVLKVHDVGMLLAGAEGYRTQWFAGAAMTGTRAKQIDQSQSNYDAAGEAMAILRNKRRGGAA